MVVSEDICGTRTIFHPPFLVENVNTWRPYGLQAEAADQKHHCNALRFEDGQMRRRSCPLNYEHKNGIDAESTSFNLIREGMPGSPHTWPSHDHAPCLLQGA